MKAMIIVVSLLLFTISPAAALPPDAIGNIQTLKGAATILRDNNSIQAATGVPVYRGDTIRTAKTGSAGIVMADDSTISLGPESEITLKDFLFNPKEGKFAYVARMAKGTFTYISGLIGKLSPNTIRLEVPDAIIAVRGTKLLINVEE